MNASVNSWITVCAIFAVILMGYLAIWLLLFYNTKRIVRAVVGVAGCIGLIACLYVASDWFIYIYLGQLSNKVQNQATNRRQVQSILRNFREIPVPLTPTLATNLGIKDKTGIKIYRYSFLHSLNPDNCMDVIYDSGQVVLVIEIFE